MTMDRGGESLKFVSTEKKSSVTTVIAILAIGANI